MSDQPDRDAAASAPRNVSQDERDELARLIKSAKRNWPSDIDRMRARAVDALALERQAAASKAGEDDEAAQLKAEFNAYSAVHRFIHALPFHDDPSMARSAQWREVLARFKDLDDEELNEWLELQLEVAANIERGIPDHRPRKDGPTFLIVLEFVANRKRKALAVLHWFEGARG